MRWPTNSTELTGDFAPRSDGETPAQFAKRMVGSAAVVYAHNDPVMSACNSARGTDAEIRDILDRYNEAVIDQIVPDRRGRDRQWHR